MITKNHQYFLLLDSPWPLISSLGSFNLLFSLSLFFKLGLVTNFLSSISLMTFISFFWWMAYKKEFNLMGLSTLDLESGVKMSMILFISSEVLFFFSFFWSYFHFFLTPVLETGYSWPSSSIISFDPFNVPFLNTFILLSSGVTVTCAHFFLINGDLKKFKVFLSFTIILGAFFTFFQGEEYLNSFFSIGDGSFGTSFFMLTGFHGIHVLIGTVFLLNTLLASLSLSMSKDSFLSFELASWYWHFVDVVWIFLFFFLYYLN